MTTNAPGQIEGAPGSVKPAGARLQTLRGAPRQVGEAAVTPIARRLSVRWPGGGWVYAWPVAVEIQTANRTRRARIWPVQRLAWAALASLALAALAGGVARMRQNTRKREDQDRKGAICDDDE